MRILDAFDFTNAPTMVYIAIAMAILAGIVLPAVLTTMKSRLILLGAAVVLTALCEGLLRGLEMASPVRIAACVLAPLTLGLLIGVLIQLVVQLVRSRPGGSHV